MRVLLFSVIVGSALAAAALGALSQGDREAPKPRTYRMGFSLIGPKFDVETIVRNIDEWSKHADGAIDHRDVPWKSLLAGGDAGAWVRKEVVPVTNLYRSRHFVLACTVDLADGIDRTKEAKELRDAGRSIAEPAVQKVYVDYVTAFAKEVKPDYLGLGSEVNLLADNLPKATYDALVKMAGEAARAVNRVSPGTKLYVSAQVEWAWGKFPGQKGFQGCERIFKDFPYVRALGVSSYPAFGWSEPEQIPLDYYRKLLGGRDLPVLMVEGGWPATTVQTIASDPDKQARWVRRLAAVLDDCRAVFVGLLTYTDLDLDSIPQLKGTIIPFFATMGMADIRFQPKPALREWDLVFKRPLSWHTPLLPGL